MKNSSTLISIREFAKEREKAMKDRIELGNSYIFNHTYYNSVKIEVFVTEPDKFKEKMAKNFKPRATGAT